MCTLKREGYLGIALAQDGYLKAVLTLHGDDRHVEFRDLSAPPVAAATGHCAMSTEGIYGYRIADHKLKLRRIDDPCEPRRSRLDGLELLLVETPVQPGSE